MTATAKDSHGGGSRQLRITLVVLIAVALFLGGAALGSTIRRPATVDVPGAVDIGFTQDMSVHHAQAVEMAGIELSGGSDATVVNLAYDILTTQQNQIGRMQGWLIAWNQPLLPAGGYMGWMHEAAMPGMVMDMADEPPQATTMPGMATTDEVAELRSATGVRRDLLFLQLMLRHHQGAIDMLSVAASQADTQYVRDLADQMMIGQNAEIALLEQLLADRQAGPLPFR